jgi:hypothetical protein
MIRYSCGDAGSIGAAEAATVLQESVMDRRRSGFRQDRRPIFLSNPAVV